MINLLDKTFRDSFKICVNLRAGIILIIHPSRRFTMPRYKLSPEERQAEKASLRPVHEQ